MTWTGWAILGWQPTGGVANDGSSAHSKEVGKAALLLFVQRPAKAYIIPGLSSLWY